MAHLFTTDRQIIEVPTIFSLEGILFASFLHPNHPSKEIIAQQRLNSFELSFGDVPLLVVSPFTFYKKLKRAFSFPRSGAYYLLWHEENTGDGKRGFLLQYLPPHSETSKHYHKKQTEIYHFLDGMISLETLEGTFHLEAGGQHTVKPDVIHQLKTTDTPSLAVIEMTNVDYKDHHYVEG